MFHVEQFLEVEKMLNTVCLQGRLVKDPEVKNTTSQTAYANFTIACERPFKDNNGNRVSDFINCVAWRNTASFIGSYFSKGDMIVLHGRIQTRTYDDKDGKKVHVTEIVVDEVSFGGVKKEKDNMTVSESIYQDNGSGELPFDI